MFPSVRGRCVELRGGGTPLFFWQFVNGTHGTPDCLKRVVPLGNPGDFDAFVPFLLAALPAAFFIACGQPNHERSSPPLLTVLLLLTGEQQEEGDGASEREDGTSGVWAPQRSFLESQAVLRSVWVEVWVENQIDLRKRS